jgi:hypothetical protein
LQEQPGFFCSKLGETEIYLSGAGWWVDMLAPKWLLGEWLKGKIIIHRDLPVRPD